MMISFFEFSRVLIGENNSFSGRLVSDKGADMLIKAFSNLENRKWSLTIIGDGPHRDYLENLALSYNIINPYVNFKAFLKVMFWSKS